MIGFQISKGLRNENRKLFCAVICRGQVDEVPECSLRWDSEDPKNKATSFTAEERLAMFFKQ